MNSYIVRKTIVIKATPDEVWDALTNPEKTKHYFFHCEVHSDWKKGSPITFKGKMFWIIDIEMNGEILDIEPGKLLKYSLKNGRADDAEAGMSVITDTLTYVDGQTVVSITDDVGTGEGAEKRYEKSEEGWDKILNGLKKFVEENNV